MKRHFEALVLAAGLAIGAAGAVSAQEVKLMTGPQGGVWVPLGGQLKDLWEKAVPGLSVQALPGAGIANVRGIEEGKTEIGFGNSISTVDAVAGNPPFTKKHANVCNVATLYPQYFQVVVRVGLRHQLGEGPQGQIARGATARQYGRGNHQAVAAGERPDLQRPQDELRVLHRRSRSGAGRPRGRLHARHHDPLRRGDGPRLRARHQAARS